MNLDSKISVVTGGASGIGLGIARALGRRGSTLILGDIEPRILEEEVKRLRERGMKAHGMVLDVSDRCAVYATADAIRAQFHHVDILVNNAGVAYNAAPLHEIPDAMIDWSLGVNVLGVLNGIKAFVPAMVAAGRGGHVVNTSSIGGFQVRRSDHWHQGLYAATKYAVTALSEGLRLDLEPHGIGISVLAPSAVATAIATSDRNRPDRYGGATSGSQRAIVADMLDRSGISPDLVGERVVRAILDNEPYVFTHLEGLPILEERHRRIEASFAATRAFLAAQGVVETDGDLWNAAKTS